MRDKVETLRKETPGSHSAFEDEITTPEGGHALATGDPTGTGHNIVWIEQMVSKPEAIQLYSHCAVFCCPSVYEPFGIINLEAMACGAPVVASATGGILEVVVEGETGNLVHWEADPVTTFPADSDRFARDLAAPITALLADPAKAKRFGAAGRKRVEDHFAWEAIAAQTVALYQSLLTTSERMTPLFTLGGLLLGVGIGIISGLVGIGGGALLVPALVLLYGLDQRKAQGTSLGALLLPIGAFAFWRYYKAGAVDLRLALLVALGFAAGGWVGGGWAQHLSEGSLRRGFALLLMVIAIRMFFR